MAISFEKNNDDEISFDLSSESNPELEADFLQDLSLDSAPDSVPLEDTGGDTSGENNFEFNLESNQLDSDPLQEISSSSATLENLTDSIITEAGNDININNTANIGTDIGNIASSNLPPEQIDLAKRAPDLPPDFFTLLLGLALAAIIIASVLLFLEVNSYGPDPLSGLPRL
ncbi:MAG: hypothetical protein LBP59_12740 [Planctomycetaceae bacterium]|jgi:hypothetical protein|nr:hypothetical protein [Planctomycetaceae bacterium]